MFGAFFSNLLRENTRESFGRTMSIPFLMSAWGLLTGGGIWEMIDNKVAPIDTAATLAVIGFGLYTGSKFLSIKGQRLGVATGSTAVEVTTVAPITKSAKLVAPTPAKSTGEEMEPKEEDAA